GKPPFANWFDKIVGATTNETLLAVSVLNQYVNPGNPKVESETGILYCPEPQVQVHLLVPATASLVRLQYADRRPMSFPVTALAAIPTASQPDPVPFINATLDKARPLLASSTTEDVIAGAELLTEAGNLDMQNRLKPTAFKNWANCVTQ